MTLSSDSIEVTHERVSQSYGNTIKVVSLKGARTLSFPWTMSAYSSVVKQLCKVCTAFLRPQLRGDFTMDRFFPIGAIVTRLSPVNHFFDRPDCQKPSSRGRLGRPRIW